MDNTLLAIDAIYESPTSILPLSSHDSILSLALTIPQETERQGSWNAGAATGTGNSQLCLEE
jgi:hypothetical protein